MIQDFDKELPYRNAIDFLENKNIKYLIFKSKRECYDIRIIDKKTKFKKEIVIDDIKQVRKVSQIEDLLYVDTHGKLCCTNQTSILKLEVVLSQPNMVREVSVIMESWQLKKEGRRMNMA